MTTPNIQTALVSDDGTIVTLFGSNFDGADQLVVNGVNTAAAPEVFTAGVSMAFFNSNGLPGMQNGDNLVWVLSPDGPSNQVTVHVTNAKQGSGGSGMMVFVAGAIAAVLLAVGLSQPRRY